MNSNPAVPSTESSWRGPTGHSPLPSAAGSPARHERYSCISRQAGSCSIRDTPTGHGFRELDSAARSAKSAEKAEKALPAVRAFVDGVLAARPGRGHGDRDGLVLAAAPERGLAAPVTA